MISGELFNSSIVEILSIVGVTQMKTEIIDPGAVAGFDGGHTWGRREAFREVIAALDEQLNDAPSATQTILTDFQAVLIKMAEK